MPTYGWIREDALDAFHEGTDRIGDPGPVPPKNPIGRRNPGVMVSRSKAAHPPKEAAKAAPEPVPERERTAEAPPRKIQHSFINADTKVTGDLEKRAFS